MVAFSLYDNPAGMGFSVVPGTHKALFPQPRSLGGMDAANSYDNSIVAQPGFKAGDALMFTEAWCGCIRAHNESTNVSKHRTTKLAFGSASQCFVWLQLARKSKIPHAFISTRPGPD